MYCDRPGHLLPVKGIGTAIAGRRTWTLQSEQSRRPLRNTQAICKTVMARGWGVPGEVGGVAACLHLLHAICWNRYPRQIEALAGGTRWRKKGVAYYRGRGSSHVVSGLDTLNFSLIRAASNLLIQPSRYIFAQLPLQATYHDRAAAIVSGFAG